MRNPVRTEAEAFSFTLVIAALALAVGLGWWLGGKWVGLGVFIGLTAGIVAGLFLKTDVTPPERAIWERGQRDPERWRVLVIANETCAGRELLDEIRYRADKPNAEVLVVAPALGSRVRHWTSDVDSARAAAQSRVDTSLDALAAVGIQASGEIGDADPLQAIEDALRTFGANEIILSTHPAGRSNWLDRDVVARARARFGVPITHVVVDLEAERERRSNCAGVRRRDRRTSAGSPVTAGPSARCVTAGFAGSPVTAGPSARCVTAGFAGSPVTAGPSARCVTAGFAGSPVTAGPSARCVTAGFAGSPVTAGPSARCVTRRPSGPPYFPALSETNCATASICAWLS